MSRQLVTNVQEHAAIQQIVSRRTLLVSGFSGLSLGVFLPGLARAANIAPVASSQVNAWINIGTDESISITVGCAEMGQGSLSGLPQIMAEELMVDYSRVRAIQSSAALSYSTGGSNSVRGHYLALRQTAAAARELLIQAAQLRLGGDRSYYQVSGGVITNPSTQQSLTYGQVASVASILTVPPVSAYWPPLVPDSNFKVIGQTLPRLDIPAKTDGSAIFGLDVRLPGMLYAAIRHCPSFGGTLNGSPGNTRGVIAVVPTKVIAAAARGAEQVGNVNAVAAVATNTWDAWQAVDSLHLNWTVPPSSASLDSAAILAQAQQLMLTGTPYVAESSGDVHAGLVSASIILNATYSLPYVAHACMEVLSCTVRLTSSSCEIWAPTQSPGAVVKTVQSLTGLTPSQIVVNTTFLGGGLGRKYEQDYISQAVQVAQAVGQPVKLMWPRSEDFTHDQYRPTALIRVSAGLSSSGDVSGWAYRHVSPSILSQRGVPLPPSGDSQATEGSTALPYAFGTRLVEYVVHPAGIPVGFWRSVGNSLNAFAVESMVDELALAAGADPYQFRRKLLAADARSLAVLDAAATLGSWSSKVPSGSARGIAICWAFNSIVAEVIEISGASTSSIRVHRVSCAVDCGRPLNPGSIEAQMQGGIVDGINSAMWGQVTFVNGVGSVKNFDHNRMMRPGEMPQVDVVIMPANPDVPIGGIGEPGVPPVAPALANAYAKLTGTRIRTLPFYPGASMGD